MVTCSNCKEIFHENATHCPACGTEAHPIKMSATLNLMSSTGTTTYSSAITKVADFGSVDLHNYAPFGERVVAFLIDCGILVIPAIIIVNITGPFAMFFDIIVGICYYGYFESSQYMGTPGKIAMKLRVLSVSGNRISFANSTGRYLAKFISGIILGIGCLFPLWTPKKQTLHDIIAGCIVVKA